MVIALRRILAAAGTAAVLSGTAAWPAWAAAGQAGQGRDRAVTGLVPRSGEWWFTSWKILAWVWPLTEGAGVTVAGARWRPARWP
jgi:hypothetical protein